MNKSDLLHRIVSQKKINRIFRNYYIRYCKYAYQDGACKYKEQYEASIIRLYHMIEKGLSYADYRPGFGKNSVSLLVKTLRQYAIDYGYESEIYRTALSCLNQYIQKNRNSGYIDNELEEDINELPGNANDNGGVLLISKPEHLEDLNFRELVSTRHSIRHFSTKPVEISVIEDAIHIAQYTPSACNRQSWRTRIIENKKTKNIILCNQNGNRGFGETIDKILLITADLCAQQRERELFQAYIDGGMFAENLLNALYYKGIGSIPLSASLSIEQESNVRNVLEIQESEVLILFIGVGNYPEMPVLTTKSMRKEPWIKTYLD